MEDSMRNRQLHILFMSNLCVFITGNGLLPLMPVYATDLGAAPALVGALMAFAYFMLATGTLMMRRLLHVSGSPRRLLVFMTLMCSLLCLLLGHSNALWQLAVMLAALWFCGGVIAALIAVLTGLNTETMNRGTVFGRMYLAMPLGALIGGATIGRLVDWQGYPFMFGVLSALWIFMTIITLSGIKVPERVKAIQTTSTANDHVAASTPVFSALLAAALLSSTSLFVGRLGTSLTMQSLNFSAGAVTEASAIGALIVIPLVPVVGLLSDRLGRWGLLSLCYGLGAVGILSLGVSVQIWHFWIAAACLSISTHNGGAIAAALATDLLGQEALNKGLPKLHAMSWIGGIVGFAMTGYLLEAVGGAFVFGGAALLSITAVLLLQAQYRDWAAQRT
jgi:MFS family permease